MKNLIIIGAGGMGRSLYDTARSSLGYEIDYTIKGFIDDNLQALDNFPNYPPLIGEIFNYIPQPDDCFVCSIGGEFRKTCIESIVSRGGVFINLIHQTARIGTNVKLGEGNIVGAFTCVAADAVVGNYNLIQNHTIIGHDVVIGDWNRIDTHVTCVGGIQIGNGVCIHTSAVINHKVVIEDGARVGACSFVIRKVKADTTVAGNPARKIDL